MCGRFVRAKLPAIYEAAFDITGAPATPSYNIAPTQSIAAVRMNNDRKECVLMRWGLVPSWAKDLKTSFINARADGVADKPSFRASFKRRRCLILADGYFEWRTEGKQKHPYYFRFKDDAPVAFAGLWDSWTGPEGPLESCAIITTNANDLTRAIHDRMPVILRASEAEAWIDLEVAEPKALLEILQPAPADAMIFYPVSPLVNSSKNNSPLCIQPAA